MGFEHFYVFETPSPTVFGEKHIVGTIVVGILIAIALILFLKVFKNVKPEKVLRGSALFLWFLELAKYTHALVTDGSFPVHYIPMQLCSFSLYLMPLVAFGKGKIRRFFEPTCFSVGLLAGLIVLLYPATVLGGDYDWFPLADNIIPIISFLYHGTMIFFSLYLLMSKQFRPELRQYPRVYLTLLVFAGMAMVTNAIFDTDMMFLNTAAGCPFQFILVNYGRPAYMLFMAVAAFILLFIPLAPGFLVSFIKDTKAKRLEQSYKN